MITNYVNVHTHVYTLTLILTVHLSYREEDVVLSATTAA